MTKKPKKDFTSSYAELKTKEILLTNDLKVKEFELAHEKFSWDKENYVEEFRLKQQALADNKEKHEAELKETTKRSMILNLLDQKKSPDEIKEMLNMLGY